MGRGERLLDRKQCLTVPRSCESRGAGEVLDVRKIFVVSFIVSFVEVRLGLNELNLELRNIRKLRLHRAAEFNLAQRRGGAEFGFILTGRNAYATLTGETNS